MRRNLPSEIVRHLRDRILKGELEPGTRLPPERDLAAQLGTNRNTLREALRALEAQGLVRARQGDGVRVQDFRKTGELGLLPHYFRAADPAERIEILADLLRLRRLVAQEAVRRAARLRTRQERAVVEARLADLLAAIEAGDVEAVALAELDLYRALTEASHSLAGLWLLNSLDKVARGFLESNPGLWVADAELGRGWQEVVGAVSAGDPDRALAALEALLERTDRIVHAFLDAEASG